MRNLKFNILLLIFISLSGCGSFYSGYLEEHRSNHLGVYLENILTYRNSSESPPRIVTKVVNDSDLSHTKEIRCTFHYQDHGDEMFYRTVKLAPMEWRRISITGKSSRWGSTARCEILNQL